MENIYFGLLFTLYFNKTQSFILQAWNLVSKAWNFCSVCEQSDIVISNS